MARYNKAPNILEMLATIFIALVFFLAKLFFKLVKYLFWGGVEITKGLYRISNAPSTPKIEPELPQNTPDTKVEDNPVNTDNVAPDKRYGLKESLLTPSEKNFLGVLEQIVGDRYIIEKQVQLSRIISTVETNNYGDFNRIKAKSIDFVLFNKDYSPYLCIELDDLSHMRWNRQKRDAFVDGIMKDVGLRIIHIRASYSYDLEKLNNQIFSK
jgi:hypothetical protein